MFCTPPIQEYNELFDQNDDGLDGIGSFFKKIAKVAAPIAAGFIPGVGAFAAAGVDALLNRPSSGKVKGKDKIQAFGNDILNGIDSLKNAIESGEMTATKAGQEADKLVNVLSDKNAVDQPTKEKNGSVILANLKQQAAQKAAEVKAFGAQFEEAKRQEETAKQQKEDLQLQLLQQIASGQINNQVSGGLDTSTLLLLGGGGLLLILLLRG